MSIAGTVLLGLGLFFMAATAIGLIRLPDFFTRVHSVSKSETLGITLGSELLQRGAERLLEASG